MEQVTELKRLGTGEIAKRVREELKQTFKNCKFSVTCKYYSGGSSINVSLMEADFKVIKEFKDIPEMAIFKLEGRDYTKENIQEQQLKNYHQLNHYGTTESFDPENWNNGVFLTEQGHNLFKQVNGIILKYHYDHSDIQSDYFDVNFYYDLAIGKWDKPFKRSEQ